MRELFIEELETVVAGQKLPDPRDYIQTTMACCEGVPIGCCPVGTWVDNILNWP